MKYHILNVSLSDSMISQVKRSIQLKSSLSIKLNVDQLNTGNFKLPLTNLQLNKVNLGEPVTLEFHLIQLKEIAKMNFNQEMDIDLLAFTLQK